MLADQLGPANKKRYRLKLVVCDGLKVFFTSSTFQSNHRFRFENRHDAQKFGAGPCGDGLNTIPRRRARLKYAWGDVTIQAFGRSSNWACRLRIRFWCVFFWWGRGHCCWLLVCSLAEKNGILWISMSFQRSASSEHFQPRSQPTSTHIKQYTVHGIYPSR